jgi:hypothetical protein
MSKRRRPGAGRRVAEQRFWGTASPASGAQTDAERADQPATKTGAPTETIRPTADPGAVVRSLGPPPLAVDATMAERHLTAVYEEAVRAATALAAANGLLATDADDEEAGG